MKHIPTYENFNSTHEEELNEGFKQMFSKNPKNKFEEAKEKAEKHLAKYGKKLENEPNWRYHVAAAAELGTVYTAWDKNTKEFVKVKAAKAATSAGGGEKSTKNFGKTKEELDKIYGDLLKDDSKITEKRRVAKFNDFK